MSFVKEYWTQFIQYWFQYFLVFLLLAFVSALMKTNGKMAGYREYETYGESSLNDAPPFLLPDPTNPKLSK